MDFDVVVAANPVWESAHWVDVIPAVGLEVAETATRLDGAHEDGGGSALNSACALARAGRKVVAVGRVGDDEPGRWAIESLRRRGIVPQIDVAPGRTTKRNFLFVERESHKTAFQVVLPPRSVPPWEDEPFGLLDSSVLLLDRLALRSIEWLRRRCGDDRYSNYLSRNSGFGTGSADVRIRQALPFLDFLQIPERDDAASAQPLAAFAHHPAAVVADHRQRVHTPAPFSILTEEEVAGILEAGVKVLLRTRGSRGIVVQTLGQGTNGRDQSGPDRVGADRAGTLADSARADSRLRTFVQPAEQTTVRDPTGAGDAFCAGFLDAVLSGLSPEAAAGHGADWAARACRYLGARAWLDHEPP